MLTESIGITAGSVGVRTTNNRGFTPEEVAEDCVKKIISISNNVDPVLRDQAVAYSRDMEKLIAFYMRAVSYTHLTLPTNREV